MNILNIIRNYLQEQYNAKTIGELQFAIKVAIPIRSDLLLFWIHQNQNNMNDIDLWITINRDWRHLATIDLTHPNSLEELNQHIKSCKNR